MLHAHRLLVHAQGRGHVPRVCSPYEPRRRTHKEEWFKWVELRRKMRAPSMGKGVNARAHWEREAKKLVVEMLYRASMVDTRSIIGTLASKRLVELAIAEDPVIVK